MNLPSIPDNLYKVLVLLGALLIGYFYFYKLEPLQKDKETISKNYKQNIDSLISTFNSIQNDIGGVYRKFAATKKEIDNNYKLIPKNDTLSEEEYKKYQATINNIKRLTLKIESFTSEIEKKYKTQISINNQITAINENYSGELNLYNSESDIYIILIIVGIFALVLGFTGLASHQRIQDELLKRQLTEKEIFYDVCQSCGKKFNSIVRYSENSDGTKNHSFCQSCYSNGQFTEPELTIEQAINRIKNSKSFGYNSWYKWQIIERIKRLDRWNEDPY